eukprot:2629266-Rhodomonas_salina.2
MQNLKHDLLIAHQPSGASGRRLDRCPDGKISPDWVPGSALISWSAALVRPIPREKSRLSHLSQESVEPFQSEVFQDALGRDPSSCWTCSEVE